MSLKLEELVKDTTRNEVQKIEYFLKNSHKFDKSEYTPKEWNEAVEYQLFTTTMDLGYYGDAFYLLMKYSSNLDDSLYYYLFRNIDNYLKLQFRGQDPDEMMKVLRRKELEKINMYFPVGDKDSVKEYMKELYNRIDSEYHLPELYTAIENEDYSAIRKYLYKYLETHDDLKDITETIKDWDDETQFENPLWSFLIVEDDSEFVNGDDTRKRLIKFMINNGLDVNGLYERDGRMYRMLEYVITRNNSQLFKDLLEAGANPEYNPDEAFGYPTLILDTIPEPERQIQFLNEYVKHGGKIRVADRETIQQRGEPLIQNWLKLQTNHFIEKKYRK